MENNWKKGPHAAKNKAVEAELVQDEKILTGDERKTVILDEDFDGLEFDDKVWLYWKRNKKFIVSTIVLAFVIVFGVQAWKGLQSQHKASMSEDFGNATTPEEQVKFAEDYAGTKLAGAALLSAADTLYEAGEFEKAKSLYGKSASELKGDVLFGRALLGEAMSGANGAGDAAALKAVYENPSVQNSYRACAGFNLALDYLAKKDSESAKKILKEIAGNVSNGAWASQASEKLSELK